MIKDVKKWNKESIQELLQTNDKAVARALQVLYANQTDTEKNVQGTLVHNGKGFTQVDARIMSSMAEWVMKGRTLSRRQLQFLREKNRIGKYHRQILLAIVAKEQEIKQRLQGAA